MSRFNNYDLLCTYTLYIEKEKDILCYQNVTLFVLAGIVGIEPTSTVLETAVLPLYYIPIGQSRFNNINLLSCFLQVGLCNFVKQSDILLLNE